MGLSCGTGEGARFVAPAKAVKRTACFGHWSLACSLAPERGSVHSIREYSTLYRRAYTTVLPLKTHECEYSQMQHCTPARLELKAAVTVDQRETSITLSVGPFTAPFETMMTTTVASVTFVFFDQQFPDRQDDKQRRLLYIPSWVFSCGFCMYSTSCGYHTG